VRLSAVTPIHSTPPMSPIGHQRVKATPKKVADALAAAEAQPDRIAMAHQHRAGRDQLQQAVRIVEQESAPAGSRPRPCPRRAGGWRRRVSCCRCAARWWRRYCPEPMAGRRRGPAARGEVRPKGTEPSR
jgi:hypothetical protein